MLRMNVTTGHAGGAYPWNVRTRARALGPHAQTMAATAAVVAIVVAVGHRHHPWASSPSLPRMRWQVHTLVQDPGWEGEMTNYAKLPPPTVHGYLMNSDFFMMNQYA